MARRRSGNKALVPNNKRGYLRHELELYILVENTRPAIKFCTRSCHNQSSWTGAMDYCYHTNTKTSILT